MEDLEKNLKSIFATDFSPEYLLRISRFNFELPIVKMNPSFIGLKCFSTEAEKTDFLIDERIISFFKVAADNIEMALVLYNFSDEEVELRWSPEFACENIREVIDDELIVIDEEELVFSIKPKQLQWICFEKTE